MSDEKKAKVEKADVLHEHPDGSPHVTFNKETGELGHYGRGGCTMERVLVLPVPVRASTAPSTSRMSSGQAKVTSDAYRKGWDGIAWGPKTTGGPAS